MESESEPITPSEANHDLCREGSDDELRLQTPDAATIHQLNFRSDSGRVPLPLPDQDRQAIAKITQKKAKRVSISILETLLATTFVCLVLALANWMPLPVLTLCLGCTAVIFMMGLVDHWLGARYRIGITWLLLISYLLAATVSLLRN